MATVTATTTTTATTTAAPPPSLAAGTTPRSRSGRPRTHSRPKSSRPHGVGGRDRTLSLGTTASSPEVITSLVESLSRISSPNPSLYGNFDSSVSSLAEGYLPEVGLAVHYEYPAGYNGLRTHLHPDDAALAPVVRTAKPPSGLSPLTSGETDAGKRMSYTAVDIPSYVRNYLHRADKDDRRGSAGGMGGSRESWSSKSGKRESRLSYVGSKERMREKYKDKELRSAFSDELRRGSEVGVEAFGGGVGVPTRGSSYGKADGLISPPRSPTVFNHGGGTGDEAAPAPELPQRKPSRNGGKPARHSADGVPKNASKLKRRSTPPTLFSGGIAGPTPSHKRQSSNGSAPPQMTNIPETARPSTADSIDDSVDAYLCSPRLSQKLRMPNTGRTVCFSEVGDPEGFAVFCCVGMGLTRYVMAFYDELALSLGLRLITPDRPGVGESEPIDDAERTVLNWPDDVLYICQSLKITKFSILAHSAGAIYALATALRMPGHIRGKIHLLAPWIPPSQMEHRAIPPGKDTDNSSVPAKPSSMPTSQRILRALPTPVLKVANSSFMSATSSSLTTSLPKSPNRKRRKPAPPPAADPTSPSATNRNSFVPPAPGAAGGGLTPKPEESTPEAAALAAAAISAAERERQLTYDERLTHSIWTLATLRANPAHDLLTCLERHRPIGFLYTDITRSVVIHHGSRDNRVPVENVRWLGGRMRRCEVRVLEGEGHGLMASPRVMGGVLEEIAAEWREWKRLVEREGRGEGDARRWAR